MSLRTEPKLQIQPMPYTATPRTNRAANLDAGTNGLKFRHAAWQNFTTRGIHHICAEAGDGFHMTCSTIGGPLLCTRGYMWLT